MTSHLPKCRLRKKPDKPPCRQFQKICRGVFWWLIGATAVLGSISTGPFAPPNAPIAISIATLPNPSTNHHGKMHIYAKLTAMLRLTSGRVLNSVFFGGGTPSLMPPETVHEILERIRFHWPKANNFECTLEANPTSVDAGRFAGYAAAGVNRISMGIQSLRDDD